MFTIRETPVGGRNSMPSAEPEGEDVTEEATRSILRTYYPERFDALESYATIL